MACPSAPAVAVTVARQHQSASPASGEKINCSVTVEPTSTSPMSPEMLSGAQPNGSSRLTTAAGG